MDLASTTPLLLALIVLLVIVAFSSGTEVAMLSVNRYRIHHRAVAGSATARTLEGLLQRPDDWLGANLVILADGNLLYVGGATDSKYTNPIMTPELFNFATSTWSEMAWRCRSSCGSR